jgi:hypothetical protein
MHGTDLAGNGDRPSADLQISRILLNTKVYNTVYIIRLPVIICSRIDQVHVRHPTSCISIFLLSSHLRLGLSSDLFLTGLHTKTLYAPLLSFVCATFPVHLILVDYITRMILC